MLWPISGKWGAPSASYGGPRALYCGIFFIFETIYGLVNMDWSNGTETIRDETIHGLRTWGGSEGMRP